MTRTGFLALTLMTAAVRCMIGSSAPISRSLPLFPFDATTLACLAPALVLWSLAYFMYRWQSRSLRLRASAPSREPAEGRFLGRFAKPKPLRPAQLARLIIYVSCLVLSSSLLSVFVYLDFLQPAVLSVTNVILTVFAYQLISIGVVLPV
ncbi:MAG TPA: hypothetical protein PL112_03360, partial [Candidatus Obscuribacter sp.]|nr:hypothetical protein [Candidatus Obscuribacter sp.]